MYDQELRRQLAQIVASLSSHGEAEWREIMEKARKIVCNDVGAAEIFAQLLEQPQNKPAIKWCALALSAGWFVDCDCLPDVVLTILSSILQKGDEQEVTWAMRGVWYVLAYSSRWYTAPFSLDSRAWRRFVRSWSSLSPLVSFQYIGGRIFESLGAKKDAVAYFERIKTEHLAAAIQFGRGAGLKTQVKQVLPRALNGTDTECILALYAIQELGVWTDFFEDVLRLSRHPNNTIRRQAVAILVRMADRDESGRARESIADFLKEHPSWEMARDYIAYNHTVTPDVMAGVLKSLETVPEEHEEDVADYIAQWALKNPHIGEMILGYREGRRMYREIVRRMIQWGSNEEGDASNIP